MKWLVLGGGSIKGAWQAGAIKAVLESGFEPDGIAGISVGSANAAKMVNDRYECQWGEVGQKLWDFWTNNIRKPKDIMKKRKFISLAWSIIRNKFNGLASNEPLYRLLYNSLSYEHILRSRCELAIGCVNINDGKIYYIEPPITYFYRYILASTAIPFAFPVTHIGSQSYYDGGIRDSAPLKVAFDKGATEIICIANHPHAMTGAEIDTGNIMQFADRTQEIITNNNLNNDIQQAKYINSLCPQDGSEKTVEPFKGKKRIPLTIIRPDLPITVSLDNFNRDNIQHMLDGGYAHAKKIIQNQ